MQPERHFAHESRVVAIGEPLGLTGDRGEEVGQGLHLSLRIIAEHVRGDEILPARTGVADTDAHALELGAKARVDRAEAIVASGAAADLYLDLERREVELVVEDGQRVEV